MSVIRDGRLPHQEGRFSLAERKHGVIPATRIEYAYFRGLLVLVQLTPRSGKSIDFWPTAVGIPGSWGMDDSRER